MSNRSANRLIAQASPYLLQHAHNPVDWYPWGEEAFAEARRRDVPILLSVGYSTCFWCHVMERESFEDEAIGRQMSSSFVCIKLDREERPDVDDIYMSALVAMRGSGGWPMNVFLEPKTLRPFWCGTYFPRESKGGMASWSQVLSGIANVWRGKRADVLSQAEALAQAVREQLVVTDEPVRVGEAQISEALQQLLKMFDRTQGGFGRAPKFPQPVFLEFLMDVRPLASDDSTADAVDEAVRRTLNGMACGGLFDQAGGGFHRYSVDERWLVPHFEKMLYDNAQLAAVYARAAAADGDAFYGNVARRTLDYVLREMTGPEGEFHSAQDAEVRGREGLNYLWMPDELATVVGAEDAELAAKVYGLDEGPNFRDPHHPGEPAQNILRLKDRPDRLARELNMPAPALEERLLRINAALYAARAAREQPRLDDKVITAWNGMMIGALAEASKLLDEPKYADAAARAADFARRKLVKKNGAMLRSWRAGVDGPGAVLEDYACLVRGLVALHRARPAGGESLALATALAAKAAELFRAGSPGRYFDTPEGASDLFVRTFSTSDGAIPSGPSTMLHALLDLYGVTNDRTHLDRASELLVALSASIARLPVGAVNATRGLLRFMMDSALRPGLESVAAGLKESVPVESIDDASIQPVEVYSDRDRVTVTADQPGKLRLVLKIAPGYHIASASPLPEGLSGEAPMLTPLRVGIAGGTGITAYADYPEGAEYGVDLGGRTERLLVHRGEIEFDVVLEKSGEVTGRPLLIVTYQACTETECLMARTVELDVAVDV